MKLLLSVATLLLSFAATAQPRFTDSTFGTNGKVIENTSIPSINIIDALLQTDGKPITLATADYSGITRTVLIRYNTNGTPDISFSGDGIADSLITPGTDCNPKAIKLQPDGKVLVCGSKGNYPSQAFVMRYNANGSLDASFGSNGIFYLPSFSLSGNSFNLPEVANMTVLSNGRIILLSNRSSPNTDFALVSINTDGTLNNSFGTNGIAIINPPGLLAQYEQPSYTHIEMQTDGKYIVGGTINYNNFALVRVNANGTLDNNYGSNGSVKIASGPTGDVLEDMVIQADGKIIVSGSEYFFGFHSYTIIIRVSTTGLPDVFFGNGGRQFFYTSATGFGPTISQLGLQADGKLLIGGMAKNNNGNYTMAVARLTTNGLFDASFDGDGIALLQVNGYNSYGYVPIQQSDGKIVVTGFARNSNNISSATIGRFTANGQTDATLNAATILTLLNTGPGNEDGYNILVQPTDQKIISVRERDNGFDYDLCVSRHLPAGQPDSSFGTNGKAFIDLPGYYYQIYSGLSADGKITIIPDFGDYVTYGSLAVFKLKANGQADSSFGQNGKKIFKSRNTDTITNSLSCAVVQADGKITMSVFQSEGPLSMYNPRDSTFLIRLNADGSFDNTFNGTGKKFMSTENTNTRLAVQPDGKILLASTVLNSSGIYNSIVRRLNADGSTDVSFNNGSDRLINTQASQITLQPNGKILLSNYDNTIVRLNSSGTYDNTFGTNGTVDATNYYPSDNGYYITNIKATNSRVMLMGNFYDTALAEPVIKIVALKDNGLQDSTFGEYGMAFPEILTYPYAYEGLRMALQADGKTVITGYTVSPNNPNISNFTVTRLKSSNSASGRLYTFTGSGNWSNPANWSGGMMPPSTITAGSSVVINTPGGQCIIDIPVTVQQGASFTVSAGSTLLLPGNLTIQ